MSYNKWQPWSVPSYDNEAPSTHLSFSNTAFIIGRSGNKTVKVKVKWIYMAPSRETSKALTHGSHSVTCNYTDACL